MIFLTRRETFNAAHRMFQAGLTDEENYNLYGKCANPNWHGHNYILYVTVCGEPIKETGILVNLKILSQVIREVIIEKIDHKNMNTEVEFMKGRVASTEQLAIAIFNELKKPVEELGCTLYSIKIQETENNQVEYFGENKKIRK